MNTELRCAAIERVLALAHYTQFIGLAGHPAQGQMVTTGMQSSRNNEKMIGFCVQVRKGRGQFGSDMVFLRHPDGSLTTHENQGYFAMTPEQESLIRPFFTDLPEDEDYSQGYKCCDKVHEIGFVIENSLSTPIPNTSFGIVVSGAAPGSQV